MALGLWLSRAALDALEREGTGRLAEALAAEGLYAPTLNGFPYGNFQARVVKRAVYHPDLGTPERRRYLESLAAVLVDLLPGDVAEGTISTLPIAHAAEAAAGVAERAAAELCGIATTLARIRDRTGRSVRVCLEPEPGCLLERTADAVAFFRETLPEAARRVGASRGALREHLGVCFDTCHQAVAFEDAVQSLDALCAAEVPVGKMQLSCALRLDPRDAGARRALAAFDEPRYLHQVRARTAAAPAAVDDLSAAGELAPSSEWRVHFHVPIHRDGAGALGTTRDFLEQALAWIARAGRAPHLPHLEVETYTWSVLPRGERPRDDASLIRGIAAELDWARRRLSS
jgi:hypothetical protein